MSPIRLASWSGSRLVGPCGCLLALALSGPLSAAGLTIIQNQGQVDSQVRYYTRHGGMTVFFTDQGFVAQIAEPIGASRHLPGGRDLLREALLEKTRVENLFISFEGAHDSPIIEPGQPLPGRFHYYAGQDQADWRTNVPAYQRLHYRGLYPGVDMDIYELDGRLEYDLVLEPGVDPSVIRMRCEGGQSVRVASDGSLVILTKLGELRQILPRTYEVLGATERDLTARFRMIEGELVGIEVDGRNPEARLVIDPGVIFSSFLGAGDTDLGNATEVDAAGSCYVTGYTYSLLFPYVPGPTFTMGVCDTFVTKFTPDGSGLVYSVHIGGTGAEWSFASALDEDLNLYVGGETTSADFPVTVGAYDLTMNGGATDAFVVKLSPDGSSLLYATYLGGSGADYDYVNDLTIDATGAAYLTGGTESADFPVTAGAFDTTYNLLRDVFVTKLSPAGDALLFSTYMGGFGEDDVFGIDLIDDSIPVVAGYTEALSFPVTAGAYDTSYNGLGDGYVARLASDGSSLAFATFLGSSAWESCNGLRTGVDGSIYVVGTTRSTTFPTTVGAFDTTYNGDYDTFVTCFPAAGGAPLYSTYVGGLSFDNGIDLAVDPYGRVHITGCTSSVNWPTTSGAFDETLNGLATVDAFVNQLSRAGDMLNYGTYLGGGDTDVGHGVELDEMGNAYVAGYTLSADFPVTGGAYDTTKNPEEDAFLTKLEFPWIALGNGLAGSLGEPRMAGDGRLNPSTLARLTLVNARPLSSAVLVFGLSRIDAPLRGGVLVPSPDIVLAGLPTSVTGELVIEVTMPPFVPSGFTFYQQIWVNDPTGPVGMTASNAFSGTVP